MAWGRWTPGRGLTSVDIAFFARQHRFAVAELVASPTMEQRQRHGCKLKSLAQAARQNPARVFAILAGIAFVCLLGTFVAQVVLAIVCGVRALLSIPLPQHYAYTQ